MDFLISYRDCSGRKCYGQRAKIPCYTHKELKELAKEKGIKYSGKLKWELCRDLGLKAIPIEMLPIEDQYIKTPFLTSNRDAGYGGIVIAKTAQYILEKSMEGSDKIDARKFKRIIKKLGLEEVSEKFKPLIKNILSESKKNPKLFEYRIQNKDIPKALHSDSLDKKLFYIYVRYKSFTSFVKKYDVTDKQKNDLLASLIGMIIYRTYLISARIHDRGWGWNDPPAEEQAYKEFLEISKSLYIFDVEPLKIFDEIVTHITQFGPLIKRGRRILGGRLFAPKMFFYYPPPKKDYTYDNILGHFIVKIPYVWTGGSVEVSNIKELNMKYSRQYLISKDIVNGKYLPGINEKSCHLYNFFRVYQGDGSDIDMKTDVRVNGRRFLPPRQNSYNQIITIFGITKDKFNHLVEMSQQLFL